MYLLWVCLVPHMVKNPPAMQETLVQFLRLEDPLEKGWATHSSILGLSWWLRWQRIYLQCGRPGFDTWVGNIPWRRAWQPTPIFLLGESPWTEEPGGLQTLRLQRVRHNWVTKHSTALWRINFKIKWKWKQVAKYICHQWRSQEKLLQNSARFVIIGILPVMW